MRKYILLILAVMLVSGCATDYLKDRAADRAREYIYDHCPEMSVENESFIKYTYPRIVTAPIFVTSIASQKYQQICFVWDLPSPKVSMIVVGSCSNYFDWYPLRMIIKNTDEFNSLIATDTATDTGRKSDNTQLTDLLKI